MDGSTERFETLVIGGGQAGLATGHYLKKRGIPFAILDANERVGDSWRRRWDSMRLFTSAKFDGLPGMPFPGRRFRAPSKDEMGDYLESYSKEFDIPLRSGVKVERLSRDGDRFILQTKTGRLEADQVVVATGAFQTPKVPPFAKDLDPGIVQMHSIDYRNPSQLREGGVLVVGVGNSGGDISIEVAQTHPAWLAGKESGHVPVRIDSFAGRIVIPIVRFMGHHVLKWTTPIGRKVMPKMKTKATPLIRVKPKDIVSAGVQRVPRITGVRDGLPVTEDGQVLEINNVIWCTGFKSDFSWIDLPILDEKGEPKHRRGIVADEPGLFFVGLFFQYSVTSDIITGVGRDAEYVVKHVEVRRPTGQRTELAETVAGS